MWKRFREKFIGDRAFYKLVLTIALPVMIQNGITSFVNMLDNLMVGGIGTEQMSGVAICNQLIFVFNLCVFGGLSGAGIYGAQFSGKRDIEGVQNVFRFKVWLVGILSILGVLALHFFDEPLLSLFLHQGSEQGDLVLTLQCAKAYLAVALMGLPLWALSQSYASTLRETASTTLPMGAGIAAMLVNLVGNWVLIYGRFGAPRLGVVGAAYATVLSRAVELGIILLFTHLNPQAHPFAQGLYRTLKVPGALTGMIVKKGMPLLLNEALWSSGQTTLVQIYSTRGLAVVAGINISNTISMLFNIVFMSLGSSIGIVVGNLLGAREMEKAKDTNTKLTAFSVMCCFAIGGILAATSGAFPRLYNTTDEVRHIASSLILITSALMPFHAYTNACYFTLRSGGLTRLTMVYDCCFVWCVCIPLAFVLCRFTALPFVGCYAAVTATEGLKALFGYYFVKQGRWIRNIVEG
ncbi:MAG: MATE family efflux transporter [Clostridia bacterium]|nr:MATE family efflux transporter [Clostridia bacterium]MBR0357595.1 MATE family efflux transporter [Clostridia bacterium]